MAAFENGDRSGCQLPLMDNLVDVVGLRRLIQQAGKAFSADGNFEVTYSRLVSSGLHKQVVKDIESRIRDYFKSLQIGAEATLYDGLVLSLRRKDAVFTFNWDPFLFDAYARNHDTADLPRIFFLHGNVRIAACAKHPENFGDIGHLCPICMKRLVAVPLLYPIETKDYSRNGYIRSSWDAAWYYFAEAFVLTIFGYGAPQSDVEAIELLKSAWFQRSDRKIEHIEIIDTASTSVLYNRWKDFAPTRHLKMKRLLCDSWLAMYPRRSVECLRHPVFFGEPSEVFPYVHSQQLLILQEQAQRIAKWE